MTPFSYMLAPIEDMTSCSFRTLCYRYGADLTFTEMIRIGGLAKSNKITWSRIELKDDTPAVIQLLGSNEQHFKRFLNKFEPSKGFKGFNLNLGCPDPRAIKAGHGCAMVRRISKTRKIMGIFKDHGYNASIKMRLGISKEDKHNKVYIHLIEAIDAEFFVVHARYGSQSYKEAADFSVYDRCVKTGKTIIANGDISTKEQVDYLKSAGLKGVMIGRAAVLDPPIFNKLKGMPSPPLNKILGEYLGLSKRFDEPFRYKKNITSRMNGLDKGTDINKFFIQQEIGSSYG